MNKSITRRVGLFICASALAVALAVPAASFDATNLPAEAQANEAVSTPIAHSAFGKWAKSRILVAPNAGLSDDDFAGVLQPHGAKSLGKVRGLDVHVVELPANANEEAVAKALARNPHVKFAEVDTIVSASATTNDPILPQEWQITKIGASTAWNTSTGAGIVVAVLDSGVQSNHPDLQANLVPGWNIYNNNNLTNDVNGHGTAVAGTIAAVGNDGIGVAGVAYRAKIMPIRISDSACNTTLSLVASGLTWAADHGADIANISYSSLYKSSTVIAAANYLRNKGGETVVSANNNAINEGSANTTSMITVSATDQYDSMASFSSWGPMVDVAAPGRHRSDDTLEQRLRLGNRDLVLDTCRGRHRGADHVGQSFAYAGTGRERAVLNCHESRCSGVRLLLRLGSGECGRCSSRGCEHDHNPDGRYGTANGGDRIADRRHRFRDRPGERKRRR